MNRKQLKKRLKDYIGCDYRDYTFNGSLSEYISINEGKSNTVYLDSEGNRTIGVGFNLDNDPQFVMNYLREAGLSEDTIELLLNDAIDFINDETINKILEQTISNAKRDALKYIPSLDEFPKNIQFVVIDMSFNMGYPVLSKFKNFKKAIEDKDYLLAAGELAFRNPSEDNFELTPLAKITKTRTKKNVAMLLSAQDGTCPFCNREI